MLLDPAERPPVLAAYRVMPLLSALCPVALVRRWVLGFEGQPATTRAPRRPTAQTARARGLSMLPGGGDGGPAGGAQDQRPLLSRATTCPTEAMSAGYRIRVFVTSGGETAEARVGCGDCVRNFGAE